jgi:hypothetical protein
MRLELLFARSRPTLPATVAKSNVNLCRNLLAPPAFRREDESIDNFAVAAQSIGKRSIEIAAARHGALEPGSVAVGQCRAGAGAD